MDTVKIDFTSVAEISKTKKCTRSIGSSWAGCSEPVRSCRVHRRGHGALSLRSQGRYAYCAGTRLCASDPIEWRCLNDVRLAVLTTPPGKVSGDAYQPCQWELTFVDDSHATLRCIAQNTMLSADKFLATKFFPGFVGEVSATCTPEKAGANERWQIIYGTHFSSPSLLVGVLPNLILRRCAMHLMSPHDHCPLIACTPAKRPGRFHLRSAHNLMLSVTSQGRARAELDITADTNMLEVTFRLRLPVAAGVAGDSDTEESGDELSRVWNELDYADEHHSIAETQVRSHIITPLSRAVSLTRGGVRCSKRQPRLRSQPSQRPAPRPPRRPMRSSRYLRRTASRPTLTSPRPCPRYGRGGALYSPRTTAADAAIRHHCGQCDCHRWYAPMCL